MRDRTAAQAWCITVAARNYDESISRVLRHEGGYTNHPQDPGGPTNWGITIHDARKYWKPNATAADVKDMPLAVAKTIYRQRYWNIQSCDMLEDGVDYAMMDYGVNSGVGRSGKVLRRLLRMSDATSAVTPDVIRAANLKDAQQLAAAICDERLAFLKSLKTWPTFGGGWGRRVTEVKTVSGVMARKSNALPAPEMNVSTGKAEVTQPSAGLVTGGAVTAAAPIAGVGFWGWIAAHPYSTAAIVFFVLVGTGVLINLIKRHYAMKQEAAPALWVPPYIANAQV
jgi:lysozyme family protein